MQACNQQLNIYYSQSLLWQYTITTATMYKNNTYTILCVIVNIVYCSCDLLSLLYMLCSLRRMVRWLYPSCSMLIECNHQPTRCVNNYHTHVSSKQLYRNLFCSESVFVQCLGIRFLLTLMLLLWNPVDMHEHVCWGTCLLNACSSVTISRDWRSILHERQEQ